MPTKHIMPSLSSRDAATVIISFLLQDAFQVLAEVSRAEHVPLHPLVERLAVAAYGVPRLVESIIAGVVIMRVGGVCPAGYDRDGVHRHPRQHYLVRVWLELVYDLFYGDYGAPGGEHSLLLDAGDAPEGHVAPPVGLLGMDDGHVQVQRGYSHQLLAGKRTHDRRDRARHLRQVRTDVAA